MQSGHHNSPPTTTNVYASPACRAVRFVATSKSIVHSPDWRGSAVRSPIHNGVSDETGCTATTVTVLVKTVPASERKFVTTSPATAPTGIGKSTYLFVSPTA